MVVSRLHSLAAIQCNEPFGTNISFGTTRYYLFYFILQYFFRFSLSTSKVMETIGHGHRTAFTRLFIFHSPWVCSTSTQTHSNGRCARGIFSANPNSMRVQMEKFVCRTTRNGQCDSFRRKIFWLTSQYGRMPFFKCIDGRCQLQTVVCRVQVEKTKYAKVKSKPDSVEIDNHRWCRPAGLKLPLSYLWWSKIGKH